MKNIWNKDRQVLFLIEQEIIFTNASEAAATVNYQSIVSANEPNLPLNVQFDLQPNDLVIRQNQFVFRILSNFIRLFYKSSQIL